MPAGDFLTPPPGMNVPIPEASKVQIDTARSQMPGPPQDPQVYYGGHTGAIANVANKMLTGFMTGKYIGEQKSRQKAAEQIGTMNDAVNQAGYAYRAAVESGDPKQIETASKVLRQQWQEFNNAREKYVIPEDDGKKKGVGGKIKGALKKEFTPQGPELYTKMAMDISKKIDPTQLFGPSKEDQLKQQQQQAALDESKTRKKLDDLSIEEKTQIKATQDEYLKAVAGGDKKAQESAAEKLNVFGKKVELPAERELQQQVTNAALDGVKQLQSGKTIDQLGDLERSAMVKEGIAPQAKNALQAYLAEVGPNKRFKNDYQAAHQYNIDVTTNRLMGQKPTPLEELRTSARTILAHDLQDPEVAKKYGTAPLKAGQQPPAWLVDKEAEDRYKHLKSDDDPTQKPPTDMAVNKIVNKALATYKGDAQEQDEIQKRFLIKDDDTGLLSFNPDPDIKGMDPGKAKNLYNSFRKKTVSWYNQLYPDATPEMINKRLGEEPPQFKPEPKLANFAPPPGTPKVTLSEPPGLKKDSIQPPPSEQKMSAPPQEAKQYPPQGQYRIMKSGKKLYNGDPKPLTAEQAQQAAAAGYQLEAIN